MTYPLTQCLEGGFEKGSEKWKESVRKSVSELRNLGFTTLQLEAGDLFDDKGELTDFGDIVFQDVGYAYADIQLATHCGQYDLIKTILKSGKVFDGISIDEPLEPGREGQCALDLERLKAFSALVRYGYGQKFITSSFYYNWSSKFYDWDLIPGYGNLLTLSQISDGLAYTRYTGDFSFVNSTFGVAGVETAVIAGAVFGFIPGLVVGAAAAGFQYLYHSTLSDRKNLLPIDDWAKMRRRFPNIPLTVWINLGCHPDHFNLPSLDIPCNKDYYDTLLCAAWKIGIDRVALFAHDIVDELARYVEKALNLPPRTRSGGRTPSDPGESDLREPELTEKWDEIKDCLGVLRRNQGGSFPGVPQREGQYWDLHSNNRAFQLLDHCPAFRDAVCKLFWRRAKQYSDAALRCGWLKEEAIYKDTFLGTKYCVSSGGQIINGVEVINCANCTEWADQPQKIAVCGDKKKLVEWMERE